MQTIATLHDPNCNKKSGNYICDECFEAFLKARSISRAEFRREIQDCIDKDLAAEKRSNNRVLLGFILSIGIFVSTCICFYIEWFAQAHSTYRGLVVLSFYGSILSSLFFGISTMSVTKVSREDFAGTYASHSHVIAAYRKN